MIADDIFGPKICMLYCLHVLLVMWFDETWCHVSKASLAETGQVLVLGDACQWRKMKQIPIAADAHDLAKPHPMTSL